MFADSLEAVRQGYVGEVKSAGADRDRSFGILSANDWTNEVVPPQAGTPYRRIAPGRAKM
jgi:hypothetical protein